MPRILSILIAFLLVLGLAAGCATPDLPFTGGGGAAARGGDADGQTGTVDPQVAYGAGVGSAANTRVGYHRQETGTQTAPTIALNLQPAAGATAAASYPQLGVIVFQPVIVMGNSQRDGTLSPEQLGNLAHVAKAAGDAAEKSIRAAGGSAVETAAKVGDAAAKAAAPGVEPPK